MITLAVVAVAGLALAVSIARWPETTEGRRPSCASPSIEEGLLADFRADPVFAVEVGVGAGNTHELEFVRRYCDWGRREGNSGGGFGKSTGYGRQYQPGGDRGTWADLVDTAVAGGWRFASEERKGDVRVATYSRCVRGVAGTLTIAVDGMVLSIVADTRYQTETCPRDTG